MSGAAWAVAAGLGFGLFQTLNRVAVRGMDVFVATFLQLAVSAAVLAGAALATEDLSRLWQAPASALANFALAGLVHFFVGWTLLNASQKRIGAARTSPLIGTTPLFGTLFAALALREVPHAVALTGIAATVVGVSLISSDESRDAAAAPGAGRRWRGALFGLGAAVLWAISPIFIRRGLAELPSPLLGVTAGMTMSAAAYGLALLLRRAWRAGPPVPRGALVTKIAAGVLVGFSVWARWIAVALAPIGVVLAISQLSVPVVIFLSPRLAGRHLEQVTARIWLGAACTVGGSLLLVLSG